MGEVGCVFVVIYLCVLAYAIQYPVLGFIMMVLPIVIFIYKKFYSPEGKKVRYEKQIEREKKKNQYDLTHILIKFINENGGIKKFEAYSSDGYVHNMKLTNPMGKRIDFSLNSHGYSKADIYTIYKVFNKLSMIYHGEVKKEYNSYTAAGIQSISYAMYGDDCGKLTGLILYSKEEYKRLQKEYEDKRYKERYGNHKPL